MSTILDSTPAERRRGLVWASNFRSAQDVALQRGTITGSPSFNKAVGVTLDGTNDYITYNLTGREFNSAEISIVIEFTPDFNWDEDAAFMFLYSESAKYRLVKKDNGDNNVFEVRLGGTTILDIPSATYFTYWLQSQRNVLVVSGTSGSTSAWLNGNNILNADVTAWTPVDPTVLYVGSNNAGTNLFDGTISSLKIFHTLLTADEAQDFYDTRGGR